MIVKEEISKYISNIFPDIDHTHFSIGELKINEWVESSLLPFLFYQNTVDSQHRIISLFLPESSVSKNLLPIYISMGFFRKVLDKTQNESKFKNESFKGNPKNITINGSVVSITELDYISQILSLDNGKINIPFDKILELRWDQYKSSAYIRDQILNFVEERNKIFKANTGNIFSFPLQPKNTDYEGAIIFTNVTEFVARLKSVKVSGENVLDFIHMQKVIICNENVNYKVETISNKKKTSGKPVSILIAPNSCALDYFNIIQSQGKSLNHIKTIIWDNFDDYFNKCNSNDSISIDDELKFIKELYFEKVIDQTLKDIYLVNDNCNVQINSYLCNLKLSGSYYSWLLKPVERLHLEGYNFINPQISISIVSNNYYYELLNELKEILNFWKQISEEFSLEGEIIKIVSFLYEVLLKLQTFIDPDTLKVSVQNYCSQLKEFKSTYFLNSQDNGIIEKTIKLWGNLNYTNLNFKYSLIISELHKLQIKSGRIILFSRNSDLNDSSFLSRKIKEEFPDIECEFKPSSEIIKEPSLSEFLPKAIFYLDFRDKLRIAPLLNIYSENQIYVIDNYEYSYLKKFHTHIIPIINDASDDINKLYLLNLENPELISEYINLKVILPPSKQNSVIETTDQSIPFNFEDFVKSIFNNRSSADLTKQTLKSDEYIVFMQDNSHFIWPASKKVFVFDEDSDSIDKSWLGVESLRPGLEILLVKKGVELKDLINNLLSRKSEYKLMIKNDKIWRERIIQYIRKNSLDYQQFAGLLAQNNFEISGITVDNWVNEHVSTPHKFKNLLFVLFNLEILSEGEIMNIFQSNYKLKNIKITFIRESVKKIICELKGILYISNNELVDDKIIDELASYINLNKIKFINKL